MKKFLAAVLAALMVLSVCSVPVMAEGQETLPDAFYVYSGESGVTEMSGVPEMSGWTVCQTVNITATTGKVGVAQLSPDGEFWDTGVIYDIGTGMISSQLGNSVTVSTSKVTVSGMTFFAVVFDGDCQKVYVNGVLAATITGFDVGSAAEYLAPRYVCADAYYDATVPGFTKNDVFTTEAMSVFGRALTAPQIAAIYESLEIGNSNYAEIVSPANVWYSIDNTSEAVVRYQVIDLASLGATTSYLSNGYTKVTTIMIPEKTYAKGSVIGIAQIRGANKGSYFASVAYDLGTGEVSIPWAHNGADWWTVDELNLRPATGYVQFIETMDSAGCLSVYVNGQLALKVHPNPDATLLDGTPSSIMNFLKQENANSVMTLGHYIRPGMNTNDDAHYVNDGYVNWDGGYPDNSFNRYGTIVLSAKGYKLPANADAIASFYKGGAGVDTFHYSPSNLAALGNWYSEEFFDFSNPDDPIAGLTASTDYTYNNEGIDLRNGYTKVAVYYIPDNSDGKIKPNYGWIDIFTDICVDAIDGSNAWDGLRYDIGSGLVRSTCTANFYRWGQYSTPIKTSGFTVFTMTFDGHTLRAWINGQLAFYSCDNEAIPVNSVPYNSNFKVTGSGKGEHGLDIANHTTAKKNHYNGDTASDIYDAYGAMLSFEQGFAGVANPSAIEELTASAAQIAATLEKTHVHDWSAWGYKGEGALKPTCTETGIQVRNCPVCGKTATRVVPATGHKWGAWTITKEPTMTENGSKFRTCETCKEVQTVEVEPLTSAVNYNGVMGKAPYLSFDYSQEGGLTDVKIHTPGQDVRSEPFTTQTKISVIKIPNKLYAAGSLIAVTPATIGSAGDYDFDIGVAYDLGTGLVSPLGVYKNILEQNPVKVTGTVEFVEVLTVDELKVYVNGVLAFRAENTSDADARQLLMSGKYKNLHLNVAGDKTTNVYARYGVKTMYGAVYHDVDVTDAMIVKMYRMSTPALEQIIDTSAIPAYKNITGTTAYGPTTNYLSEGGTGRLNKSSRLKASSGGYTKITVLNIPDVSYAEDMTVGISLLSQTGKTNYDFSVKYNLATGEISPVLNTYLKDITVSARVRATGYVQFVEVFTGTNLKVYVNGQLAFAANVIADNINSVSATFLGGTYKYITLNATGDGAGDAAELCYGVKTMYFNVFSNSSEMTAAKVTQLHELFLDSLSRAAQPAPEPAECTHEHTEIRNAEAATCTKDGYTGDVYCTDCNELVETGTVIPKAGHKTEIRNAEQATCTKDGYTGDFVCTVCGETIKKGGVIPSEGHKTELRNAKEATCTEDGYTGDTVCTVCGETIKKGETIPAPGHKTEIRNAKEATCTEDGYTGDTVCTVCGETIKQGEVIPSEGHKTEIRNAKEATCTENGYTGDTVCTVCGETIKQGETIPAPGHKTEIRNAKEATCTEDGYTGDTVCTVCGETIKKGETITAPGHKTEIRGAKDATCTEDGYTGDTVCTVCGETVETGKVIPKGEHKTELRNVKEATCTEDGYTGDSVCTICGETVETGKVIPKGEHKTTVVGAKEATCTENGYTGDTVCSVCGTTVKKGEVIYSEGHKTETRGAKDATCTEDGYTGDTVCTVCNETVETGKVIPATGHKTELRGVKEATCTEDGYTGDTVCTVCGETIKQGEVIPSEGHKTEIRNAKEATCTEDGYTGDTVCTVCGETIKQGETIPAPGHKTEIRNAEQATCTKEGYTGDVVCTVCGETVETGTVIAKTPHNYVNGVCTACGATQEVLSGFVELDGNLYYYEDGAPKTGWFVVDGKTYYGSVVNGVCRNSDSVIGGKQYFWDNDKGLVIAHGFYEVEGGTVCFVNGIKSTGWRHKDGSGPAVNNEIYEQYSTNPNGLYYFLPETGFMVTDATCMLGGYLREFNEDHTVKPLNGLQTHDGDLYYYVDGVMQTGWQEIGGNTYYFRRDNGVYGRAAIQWISIAYKLYYFNDANSEAPYTLKTSGEIGGIAYDYAADGHILYNGFVNCIYANEMNDYTAENIQKMNATTRYYVNGEMQTAWQEIDGNWYYFYILGSAYGPGYLCTASRTIGGVWFEFDENFVCQSKGQE